MKKYLLMTIFLLNNNLYPQWELRINGLPNWSVADPLSVAEDSTIAVFVRTSYFPRPISISNNLGNLWTNYNTPDQWDGSDISVFDKRNIWFCTGEGKVYHTSDGGINWEVQFKDTVNAPFFNFIKFFDKDNGIVVGDAISALSPAVILKTTDGGNNWISINDNYLIGEFSRDVFFPIEFPSLSVGYYYGSRNNKLYKTIDGGNSWQIVSLSDGINKAYMLKFYNENIGILVSDIHPGNDSIYRTINGGDSWTKLSLLTNTNHHDIEFLPSSPSKVWFTDHDHLFFSADTGNTWQEVTVISGSLEARNIEFLNDTIGFILCDNGKFFTTENNGGIITSIGVKDMSVVNDYCLFQNYPNPFNATTKITYSLARASKVSLKVYDIIGNEIITLVDGTKEAGIYDVVFKEANLTSGVYLYKLTAGDFISTKKMILLK